MQLLELGLVIFCSGHKFPTSGKATTGRKDYRMNLFHRPSSLVHRSSSRKFSLLYRVGGVLGSSNTAALAWIGNFLFRPPISDIGQGNHRKKGLSHESFQQTLFISTPFV
jgi:hypothetical protein